jgi:hypothetical protein
MTESSGTGILYSTSVDDISSIADLFDVAGFHPEGSIPLHRGQDVDEPLLPGVARLAKRLALPDPESTERELLSTFKSMSMPFLNASAPTTDWEWMALARHHGLPTRLLDWTSNAFFALWFAVFPHPDQINRTRVLWVLDLTSSDLRLPERKTSVFTLGRTFAFQPPHISRNIAAQSAWLTVHKYIQEKAKFIALEANVNFGHKLRKYYIHKDALPPIRAQLKLLGINQFSLFPDLDHLASHLEEDLVAKTLGYRSERPEGAP